MSEIALKTKEFIGRKSKYIAYRPIGSTVVSIPTNIIRRKWLEIVCDLVSPKKREMFKNIPGWKYLCDHWTQQLWDEWRSKDVPSEKYPIGELTGVNTAAQTMWDERVDPQLISLIGKEPGLVKDKCDTWLWSEYERKNFFIVANEDAEHYEVQEYMRHINMIKDGKIIIVPAGNIDYVSNIGLSQDTLDKISDPDVVVDPKFDSPVSKTVISSPDLSKLAV